MEGKFVTSGAQAAVLAALARFGGQSRRGSPWVLAADLATFVGAPGADDPQFEAVVRSLYAAGAIRLLVGEAGSSETGSSETGYKAMLVRPS